MIDRASQAELRERLRADYAAARVELLRLLDDADPMGLGSVDGEYDLEVDLILPRLRKAASPDDVAPILHEIFTHCFGAPPGGDLRAYSELAARVWETWQRYPLIHDPHYKLVP